MSSAYPSIAPGFIGAFTAAQLATMNPASYPLQSSFILTSSSPPYGYLVQSDGTAWQLQITADPVSKLLSAGGAPVAANLLSVRTEGATLTFASADTGGMSLTPVNLTVTVTPQAIGFYRHFNGAGVVSFTGSGVTVTDKRITGATNPVCYIVFTSTTTADVIGSMA